MPSCNGGADWSIQIPLSALVALKELPGQMEALQKDNRQLRQEVEALRRLYSETLQAFADYKHEMRKK